MNIMEWLTSSRSRCSDANRDLETLRAITKENQKRIEILEKRLTIRTQHDVSSPPPSAGRVSIHQAIPAVNWIWHTHPASITQRRWRMTPSGIEVTPGPEGPLRTPGKPITVGRIIERFGHQILAASKRHGVPMEFIVATIATESRGDPRAHRDEKPKRGMPHWSRGLMQVTNHTASDITGKPVQDITVEWMESESVDLGTRYINLQKNTTGFDPVLVSVAYNAGSVRADGSLFGRNQWGLEMYSRGAKDSHASKWCAWFGDTLSNDLPTDIKTFLGR